ncbi:aminopeptidase P family protein [Clostridium estertheticum]|uniref:aminopeptidase P family protein n=1 Tax=Clostridium estertheticum TaxID=238834 RepID=UPI001C0E0ED7|nr:aminopeptidase P family protein [Clostridium estertheticum]MBU3071812.1 aminopeptidase P family protein [Clostridium estertheticum]MBU3161904.1 aminopeptidase P family protein [Clostridium estertheticum]MBU3171258.1 aminopeptidase P family protein [Clostridium estertheticum]
MSVKERIEQLRNEMRERGIDAFIVPSSDPHQSEYVAEHYSARTFITGFTGSAGTAIVTLKEAGLWTDGRYFIQAENQLIDTGVTLFRMGNEGVPTVEEFLKETLKKGAKIAFDGKVISIEYFRGLKSILESSGFSYEVNEDLVDIIWKDRPQKPCSQVILHDVVYAGESRESKLARVAREMETMGANYYVISGLDDIAWLLNIRARDVKCNPLTISYTVVSEKKNYLFIDDKKINPEVRAELEKANVEIKPYESIGEFLRKIKDGAILLDAARTSTWIYSSIKIKILEAMDITTRFKGIKNEIQIKNVRKAMLRDGVAMVKFITWMKKTIKSRNITEIEASDKIEEIRSVGENFYDLSFASISAYKANASMPHYCATKENQATIKPEGLYLLDSGAQYLDGTTDITRTLAVGPLTKEEKTDYTLVLRGMINLTLQRFLYGTTGSNLDIIARIPLWNAGMDYKHGTGHGVGFFLNVHEGPHRISVLPNNIVLKKGMIVSNEPGVYKAGKHGIRIENLVVAQEDEKTEYGGQFMKFETLTLCPIDLDAIDVSLLTNDEKSWLNNYHKTVFEKLSTHLQGEELAYLKGATIAI